MITINLDNLTTPKEIIAYAKETSILNLAENHSDVKCSEELVQLVGKYLLPNANSPSPTYGLQELRRLIADNTEKLYEFQYDAEDGVTVTTGIKHAVFCALLALLKEGDEVIVFEPAHKSYESAIKLAGARPVYVSLNAPEFQVSWEDVQKLISSQTRMIIINSPHFPTGSTLSELDMIRLQKILNGTNIIVLSDESFEHLVFDGEMHQSVMLYPLLRERSVVISSFNETLSIPNWHIGYCMSSSKLMKEIRRVISIVGSGLNLPYQMAILEYLKTHNGFNHLSAYYQRKRDLFLGIIEDSNIKASPSKGTYFQLITLEGTTDKTDKDMALRLIKDHDIATIPISYYYHENSKKKYLRVNLSLPDEVLVDVANRLKNI